MDNVSSHLAEPDAVRSELEGAIRTIWAEAMEIPDIGPDDDFFAIGGHSLIAIEISEKIRTMLNTDRLPIDLFATPTVATLTDSILTRLHAGAAT